MLLCFAFIVTGGGSVFQTSTCLHICFYALDFLSSTKIKSVLHGSLWSDIRLTGLLVGSIDGFN